ncbi:MAG: hypothetical protein ACR2QH_10520 [Geminicoccaceae bacterium]
MIVMGCHFHRAIDAAEMPDFCSISFAQTLMGFIENPDALLIVADNWGAKGMLAAMVCPHYLNRRHLVAQELFWWMEPGHGDLGDQLFQYFESWAKAKGAKTAIVTSQEQLRAKAVGRIYRSKGYVLQEHNFMRRL